LAFRKRRQLATVTYSTDQLLEASLVELHAHVEADEKTYGEAPIGHLNQLGALLVTDMRLLWRFIEPNAPVLSLNFTDISEVKVDEGRGVQLTYRPVRSSDELGAVHPQGDLDAEFIFQRGDDDVRELVLGRARREVELKGAGATLASGVGYLSGLLETERYQVKAEARESALVLFQGRLPMWLCRYTAVAWFCVDPLPKGLKESELLGVGSTAIWLAIAGEGVEDRWRLVVKPNDLDGWRVILEHFGIRDAAAAPD
jgi:hypothetical protein